MNPKAILSFLAVFALASTCLSVIAIDDRSEGGPGDYTFEVDGFGYGVISIDEPKAALMVCLKEDTDKDIRIPSSVDYLGNKYAVTVIAEDAFSGRDGLTGKLTIPYSVTAIQAGAFTYSGFTGTLTIPDSVTTIQNGAFTGCEGFTGKLTIPESVESIGVSAFIACTGFTSVSIPDSVKSIEARTFMNCTGLKGDLKIPNSVESIGKEAFKNCAFDGKVTIPGTVGAIGDGAFIGCAKMNTLDISKGVEVIGAEAFSGCTGLTKISISQSVKTLGDGAFDGITFYDKKGTEPLEKNVENLCGYVFSGNYEKMVRGDKTNEEDGGSDGNVLIYAAIGACVLIGIAAVVVYQRLR